MKVAGGPGSEPMQTRRLVSIRPRVCPTVHPASRNGGVVLCAALRRIVCRDGFAERCIAGSCADRHRQNGQSSLAEYPPTHRHKRWRIADWRINLRAPAVCAPRLRSTHAILRCLLAPYVTPMSVIVLARSKQGQFSEPYNKVTDGQRFFLERTVKSHYNNSRRL